MKLMLPEKNKQGRNYRKEWKEEKREDNKGQGTMSELINCVDIIIIINGKLILSVIFI